MIEDRRTKESQIDESKSSISIRLMCYREKRGV
jgi:hypothetical protein